MGRFLAHLLLIVALAGLRLAAGYYSITAAASVIGHLVDGDRRMAFRSLGVSAAFMAASAVLRAVFTLQAELASIVWRRALVTRLHGLYTDDRSALYYTLRGVDYPDQRIAKDATDFCDMFVTLVDTLALSPPTIAMYTYLAWRSVGWLAPTGTWQGGERFLKKKFIFHFSSFMTQIDIPFIVKRKSPHVLNLFPNTSTCTYAK